MEENQNHASRYYKDLIIWQKGILLAKEVYNLSQKFPQTEIYGLTSQIRRAVVSVPSNIAEGQGRLSQQEFIRFLHIALGSLAEVDTQLTIALELGYITQIDTKNVNAIILELRRMIHGLINGLNQRLKQGVRY